MKNEEYGPIEKGLPISTRISEWGPNRDKILEMEVGDSRIFKDKNKALSFCASMHRMGILNARRKQKNGIRVWRIL